MSLMFLEVPQRGARPTDFAVLSAPVRSTMRALVLLALLVTWLSGAAMAQAQGNQVTCQNDRTRTGYIFGHVNGRPDARAPLQGIFTNGIPNRFRAFTQSTDARGRVLAEGYMHRLGWRWHAATCGYYRSFMGQRFNVPNGSYIIIGGAGPRAPRAGVTVVVRNGVVYYK